MRKKLLSILLVLSLILALVPAAFAADAVRTELESDGTTLAFYGSGVATADCWNGDWTAVTHVDLGYEIRGVAENVLARCVNLVSFEAIGSRYLRTYNGGLISIDGRQMLAAPNRCTAYEILDLVQTVNFNAPIHHYGSWTGTDPNCTTEGKRTRTCTDDGCGHTEEMTLPARGHYWGIGRVTTLPTETTTGVRTYTCRTYGCNATRTEEIPKLAPRVPVSERFDDVAPNSWAYEDIQYCVDYELMAGVGGGRFDPKTLTTRAQLVQILYRLAGAPEVSGETPFTDLTADWYKTAVLWAYQTGVTSGVSETTFAPDTPVTREQVAVFLARFADRVLDRYTPYMWDALFPFQDREQISYYARTAMNWACDLGLIKGIPGPGGLRLEPQSSATREQMAVMIARFCRRLNVWNEPMPEL